MYFNGSRVSSEGLVRGLCALASARPRLCICSASRSNRLPPRLRVALQLISSSHRLPPRLRVALTYRHASASLCLAVARAPLLMHLVIHLVRQIESPPLPPEAADDETSNRVPVVVVVLRLLRPYLCVLASALAACAPLSVRPRLYILLYILFVKLKLPRSLPKRRMTRPRIEFP